MTKAKIWSKVRASIGALALLFTGAVHAQIPVTDGAAIATTIANQVESIAKWTQQFNQMKQQLENYQQQFASITGARGIGDLLDNPLIKNALPPDWASLLANVKSTAAFFTERAKFPVLVGRPKTNALFDVIAAQNATLSDLYTKSQGRLAQVQSLMGQIDSAFDPAAKSDLANRILSEQAMIQANTNLATMVAAQQKAELDTASRLAAQEFSCNEFKRAGGC